MRWTSKRKVAIVNAIGNGEITIPEAKNRYDLSEEELAAWTRDYNAHGLSGLLVTKLHRYSPERRSQPDDGPGPCIDFAERDRVRTRRLAAKLYRTVRPILSVEPPRRENLYIALDAFAWATAMIFAGTEDRGACDFYALALKQNLARMEEREMAANVDPSPPAGKALFRRDRPKRSHREPAIRRSSR